MPINQRGNIVKKASIRTGALSGAADESTQGANVSRKQLRGPVVQVRKSNNIKRFSPDVKSMPGKTYR